jgi:hypothetical protein
MHERRTGRRFHVQWPARIGGVTGAGESFDEPGALKNISSGGAFLYITSPVEVGAKLDVFIKVPFRGEEWMLYRAEVLRVECSASQFGVALKFFSFKPEFRHI